MQNQVAEPVIAADFDRLVGTALNAYLTERYPHTDTINYRVVDSDGGIYPLVRIADIYRARHARSPTNG